MLFTFVLCQFTSRCWYSEIRTRLYTLSSEAKAQCTLVTSGLRSRTSLHNLIALHKQKSSIPIKFPFPFPYSPMMFPPHACYLALVRVVRNNKIRETFSCLAIFLSVTMLVRLSRNCATQILNFVSCSDWFSRNYHAPATSQKILPSPQGKQMLTL